MMEEGRNGIGKVGTEDLDGCEVEQNCREVTQDS